MIVVSDTSAITSLIQIGQSGLLKALYHTVSQLELEAGFRLSDPVKSEAFRLAGE